MPRLRFPHPLTLLVAGIFIATALSFVLPMVGVAFATAGALEHMQEEIIALIPVLLVLTRRVGFDALTAVAMSIGAASVGAAFSPMDPFQVGIAQKLAQLPLLSGAGFRLVFLALAVGIWIWGTIRHALRIRTTPHAASATAAPPPPPPPPPLRPPPRILLAVRLLTFLAFLYGGVG